MAGKDKATFLNPDELIEEFDLKKGMKFADFGSGAGHFSIAAARLVGDEGVVSAIDVRESILNASAGHAQLEGLMQIQTIRGDLEIEEGSTLSDSSQDVVLISNLLHQVEEREKPIQEAARVLREDGKLFIIDWKKDAPLGPGDRISMNDAKNIAEKEGFRFLKELNAGMTHYAMVFRK